MALKKAYNKAQKAQKELETVIKKQMQAQFALENENCSIVDMAADPTAQMVAKMAVLCSTDKALTPHLWRFGIFLGKLIYLLDASEDYEKDKETGSFNVFVNMGLSFDEMKQVATDHCILCASELSAAYCQITLKENKDILDNIVYLGLPKVINNIGNSIQKEKMK